MSWHRGASPGSWSAAVPHASRKRSDRPAVAHIPRATYRVQLNAGFTFKDLTAIVPYLAALGISHVYCSPYFRARAGSAHGYDVVDHNSLNPEIGSRQDFDRLITELRAQGMSHLLDIVPNHVGVMGSDNAWWMDVLENGQASIYADYFDIDWNPVNAALTDKVLVPVLADPYGEVLERGDLELRFERELGSFAIRYHEHRMPLDPRTYPRILDAVLDIERSAELEKLRRLFGALPDRRGLRGSQRHGAGARPDRGHPGRSGELRSVARPPRVASLPAGLLASGLGRHQLPPILRRQRSRGAARGERGCVRGDASAGSAAH